MVTIASSRMIKPLFRFAFVVWFGWSASSVGTSSQSARPLRGWSHGLEIERPGASDTGEQDQEYDESACKPLILQ